MQTTMMRNMLEIFQGLTPEKLHESTRLVLGILLIRKIAQELNLSHSYAAKLVGKMKIEVSDEAYASDPEVFHDLIGEMVRIIGIIYRRIADEFGDDAALAFIESAAGDFSLTAS